MDHRQRQGRGHAGQTEPLDQLGEIHLRFHRAATGLDVEDASLGVGAADRAGDVRRLLGAALLAGRQSGAEVFHWARRDRVLLREVLRFGTAT